MKYGSKLVAALALLAVGAGILSWHFGNEDVQRGFWSGLFLNIVPEALGVAAGIIGTLYLAARKASARFTELAEKIFDLIAQLRSDAKITPDAAQKIMVVVVPLLDERVTPPTYKDGYLAARELPCRICSKESPFRDGETAKKCNNCGLKAEYWRGAGEPSPPQ
jgi:hypothetical protein